MAENEQAEEPNSTHIADLNWFIDGSRFSKTILMLWGSYTNCKSMKFMLHKDSWGKQELVSGPAVWSLIEVDVPKKRKKRTDTLKTKGLFTKGHTCSKLPEKSWWRTKWSAGVCACIYLELVEIQCHLALKLFFSFTIRSKWDKVKKNWDKTDQTALSLSSSLASSLALALFLSHSVT